MDNFKLQSDIDERLKTLGSYVDLTEAPPIHQKRLVAFFNHFVISTVDFLNSFSQSCAHRLFAFEQKIRKLEAELKLLETKINSIPELEDKKDVNVTLPPPQHLESPQETESEKAEGNPQNGPKQEESKNDVPVNPEIAKFKRLIELGAQAEQVKLRMKSEGLDPSLLDV